MHENKRKTVKQTLRQRALLIHRIVRFMRFWFLLRLTIIWKDTKMQQSNLAISDYTKEQLAINGNEN